MISHKYVTRQRKDILRCLRQNRDRHLSVDDILRMLSDEGCAVGKATVYRFLDKLVQDGEVRRFTSDGSAVALYQYNSCEQDDCTEHFHIKCSACGKLEHLDCERVKRFFAHVRREHGFEVDVRRTVFYGICRECLRNGRG